ncbi:hypothetical protein HZ326_8646 [Fusarium oxysporum f. sp. albedinis]|nr:hypothetical protein HZ326_8646 [Fusarium oxysporum f. sp. albedinis]
MSPPSCPFKAPYERYAACLNSRLAKPGDKLASFGIISKRNVTIRQLSLRSAVVSYTPSTPPVKFPRQGPDYLPKWLTLTPCRRPKRLLKDTLPRPFYIRLIPKPTSQSDLEARSNLNTPTTQQDRFQTSTPDFSGRPSSFLCLAIRP